MKFLLDQNIPPAMVDWLQELGAEAAHVRDVGLASVSDHAVLRFALANDLAIVSKDSDFSRLVAANGPKVVWLKVGNARNPQFKLWLEMRWAGILERLQLGASVVIVE